MRSKSSALSLLEVVIVLVILAVLVTLVFPLISTLRARAQRAQCTANLRNLYLAANLYLQDKGSWPQIRLASQDDAAAQDYAKQWIDALKPFGPAEKTWICPTIQNASENPDYMQPENIRTDYFPMPFDDKPGSPHQWPRQPWFVEVGDVHGNGNLIVFADGSISDLKTVVQGRGSNQQALQSNGLAPANDKESAIITNLDPGSYSAVVRGKGNTTGVALVEVYNLSQ